MFFFCCLGRGRVFFFAVWAGDGSSLTYRSAWLVFKRPNNKKDQTAKKKHGFQDNSSFHFIFHYPNNLYIIIVASILFSIIPIES